jgi:protein-S-isoprenylcysteine O-methyltransferase Ste14
MLIVGTGWLIALPACILYWEHATIWPSARPIISLPLGLLLFVAGAVVAVWAGFCLICQGGGTPLPFDPPSRLVTCGPYHFVRNPQAIAMVLMVLGELVAVESSWLWVMMPLTIVYLEVLVGPLETRQLTKDFGPEYERYAARVGKWLPNWHHTAE